MAALVSYLAIRKLSPGRELKGATYLALYLLDHSQTYVRAVAALVAWKGNAVLEEVLRSLTAYVRVEDRATLGL